MILKFKDATNNEITKISTIDNTIQLNLEIDFEDIVTGTGQILHNGIVIGIFTRDIGSAVNIVFSEGNYSRKVNHGDIFRLIVTSPVGITTTAQLEIERVRLTRIPSVAYLIKEVTKFDNPRTISKLIRHQEQISILNRYSRQKSKKHMSTFVRELLYPIKDIYAPTDTIFPTPDAFYCEKGVTKVISVDDILNNDFVRVSGTVLPESTADMLEITGVKNVVGGIVTPVLFNGKITSLKFNSTVAIGNRSTFVCDIRNKVTGNTHESKVEIFTKEAHPVTSVNDVFNVIQWNTLVLTKTQLLSNDMGTNPPLTFVEIVSGSVYGGTVNISESNISFQSTGLAGQPAGFQYRIKDSKNNMSVGSVAINVLELPTIEAYLFSTSDLTTFINSYTPPTLAQIYNTWARFSNNGLYFPPGSTPTGEAASWELYGTGFRCTVNSSYLTGFISPKTYDNYVHTATLSSSGTDDDTIAIVLAFRRIESTNYVLLAVRTSSTTNVSTYTGTKSWSLALQVNGVVTILKTLSDATIVSKSGGWSTLGPTRVKIERIGSMITAYCSQFGTTTLLPDSKLEIDLNNSPVLSWALDPCSYGYACLSQQYSTYSDVVFEGGINANEIFDFDLNCTWEYIGGVWTKNTSKTIQSVLGYPRTVINPENGYTYRIEQNSITRIS